MHKIPALISITANNGNFFFSSTDVSGVASEVAKLPCIPRTSSSEAGIEEKVAVGFKVGVLVGVGLDVFVGIAVGLDVTVGVGVGVLVGVAVGSGVGVGRL